MITTGERLRANAWGRYYVTDECNACGICASFAPYNFSASWDGTYYSVCDQPSSDEEEQAVRDAMEACPEKCIRADWEAN